MGVRTFTITNLKDEKGRIVKGATCKGYRGDTHDWVETQYTDGYGNATFTDFPEGVDINVFATWGGITAAKNSRWYLSHALPSLLPQAIQGYHHDIAFSATDWDTVAWAAGTIKFYDGTTQSISAGNTGNLPTGSIYYIYFDLSPGYPYTYPITWGGDDILRVTTDYLSVMDARTGMICLVQRASDTGIKATFIPSYGKEPLLTPDFIDMTGLKVYDYGDGKHLQAILDTQISAGNLKLTAATVKDGEWYDASGVEIDATHGINIYGTANALTTRATKAGTIQCYVGADGKLYAGGGTVSLDSTGIKITGAGRLNFLYNGTPWGYISSYAGSLTIDAQEEELRLSAKKDIHLRPDTTIVRSRADIRPYSNNDYDLGTTSYRWKNLWAVTVHQGDTVFSNDWRLTESEDDKGIRLLRPDGSVAQEWR